MFVIMKRDLKTILTLWFSVAIISMTIMWLIKPEVAVVPVYLSIMAYYFNKKETPTSWNTITQSTSSTQI